MQFDNQSLATFIATDGFAIKENVVSPSQIEALYEATKSDESRSSKRVAGKRNLLELEAIRMLARSPELRKLIEPILGREYFAVRAILFDKNAATNWKVPFHQDLSIAVRERADVDGFSPWSLKDGVVHVQPPIAILESMLTLRVHLDDCSATNGALRVLPGSHCKGRFDAAAIARERNVIGEQICVVRAGGVLLMRPLLLHASSCATSPARRRVVHIEYAACDLPDPLQWHQRI
jgi:ectoine hydroxylase-related dioxygenase (phytanoyl-CoA dioxygenase family)